MKNDSLYKETPKQFFDPTLIPILPKYSPDMTLNWVKIESARQGYALKIKVFDLNVETPKYFSDPTPPPKQPNTAQNSKNDHKIGDIKNASQMHAQKMKVDRLYKETPKSFLTIT